MGQEADSELKFLHDLDIGYENLHKFFEVYHFRVPFYSSLFKGTQIIGCTVCIENTSLNKLWTSPTWDMKYVET